MIEKGSQTDPMVVVLEREAATAERFATSLSRVGLRQDACASCTRARNLMKIAQSLEPKRKVVLPGIIGGIRKRVSVKHGRP